MSATAPARAAGESLLSEGDARRPRTSRRSVRGAEHAAMPASLNAARLRFLRAQSEPMLWLTAAGLGTALLMIVGLLALVVAHGLATFWPVPVVSITTTDGKTLMGEIARTEYYLPDASAGRAVPQDAQAAHAPAVERQAETTGAAMRRRLVRVGNFELTGEHFRWVSDFDVATESRPAWALVFERTSWGRFYGFPAAMLVDGNPVATQPEAAWRAFLRYHDETRERWQERRRLETRTLGAISRRLEEARLHARDAEMTHGTGSSEHVRAVADEEATRRLLERELAAVQSAIEQLKQENARYVLRVATGDGQEASLALADIVRAYPANRLGAFERLGVYLSRCKEFLTDEPREANSEGGVFPAIFGTVAMTLVMSLMVTPLGVLAALYLREYAKPGPLVSAVRIAVNNLAGVPSIVFGVFGLGFFCYIVGAAVDASLFSAKLPTPTFGTGGLLWASLTLALLTLPVVIVATEEALAAVPSSMREGSYACGASKWQTIRRIVLPRAMPGILTGMILAVARGAGEVAPLMLVGAVKLAPELPMDGIFPYVHLERSFMHLGFHIYDLGFQSQNSEAAKPVVFTTTLLLVAIIATLNITAVALRTRLRRRFAVGQF